MENSGGGGGSGGGASSASGSRSNQNALNCGDCQYSAISKQDYIFHQMLKHSFTYNCKHCGRAFEAQTDVITHVLQEHWGDNDLSYKDKFEAHNGLNLNEMIPPTPMPAYPGQQPMNQFYSQYRASIKGQGNGGSHKKKQTGPVSLDFKCDQCDYATAQKWHLKQHISGVHLKEKPYKCHACSYAASRKNRLDHHIKVMHTKDAGFKCHFCDYRSDQKVYYEQHMTTVHFGYKSFGCLIQGCNYTTNYKPELDAHCASIHKNM